MSKIRNPENLPAETWEKDGLRPLTEEEYSSRIHVDHWEALSDAGRWFSLSTNLLQGSISFEETREWTICVPYSRPNPVDLAKMTSIRVDAESLDTASLQPPSGPYTVIQEPPQPLSRRDEFAKAAMQGLLAKGDGDGIWTNEGLAVFSVRYADAVIAALDRKEAK